MAEDGGAVLDRPGDVDARDSADAHFQRHHVVPLRLRCRVARDVWHDRRRHHRLRTAGLVHGRGSGPSACDRCGALSDSARVHVPGTAQCAVSRAPLGRWSFRHRVRLYSRCRSLCRERRRHLSCPDTIPGAGQPVVRRGPGRRRAGLHPVGRPAAGDGRADGAARDRGVGRGGRSPVRVRHELARATRFLDRRVDRADSRLGRAHRPRLASVPRAPYSVGERLVRATSPLRGLELVFPSSGHRRPNAVWPALRAVDQPDVPARPPDSRTASGYRRGREHVHAGSFGRSLGGGLPQVRA